MPDEILMEILQKLNSMDKRFDSIDKRLDSMDRRLDSMDKRLDSMDKRLDSMDKRFDSMDKRLDSMDKRLDGIDDRFDLVYTQLKEHTQILLSLEHNSQVHKSEMDKITMDIAKMSGSVKSINDKVEEISYELNFVEQATGKNISDIARLKAIK